MSNPSSPGPRLVSLDAFRGATVAAMLLVNNPGSWSAVYPPLLHAPWHGWTVTDAVFPAFLWIVGVSMTLSFGKRMQQGADRGALLGHAARRAAILIGLGLFMAAFPFGLLPAHTFSLGGLRLPGVLQRIGLCYLAASAIVLGFGWRGQLAWVCGLLAAYGAALAWVPVPGFGPGVLEPTGNLAWWVDSNLLAGHTWSGAPAKGFDPEGLLSTIPAIATTLLGVLAGHVIRGTPDSAARVRRLAAAGAVLVGAGWVLHGWIPINKNLWTPAFAVGMAGGPMLVFTLFYWAIDHRGWKAWATPFVIYGVNAITAFVLSGLVAKLMGLIRWEKDGGGTLALKTWLHQTAFSPWFEPRMASLLFALAFVAAFQVLLWIFWRRGWIVRI